MYFIILGLSWCIRFLITTQSARIHNEHLCNTSYSLLPFLINIKLEKKIFFWFYCMSTVIDL